MAGNDTFIGRGERWPYSTNQGAEIDQKNAGDRKWEVRVQANNIKDALKKIEIYQSGIQSSPHVWQAPINSIEKVRP